MDQPKSLTHTWPKLRRLVTESMRFRKDEYMTSAKRRRRDDRWMLGYLAALFVFALFGGDTQFLIAYALGAGIGWIVRWVSGPTVARAAAGSIVAIVLIGCAVLAFGLEDDFGPTEGMLAFALVFALVMSGYFGGRSAASARA